MSRTDPGTELERWTGDVEVAPPGSDDASSADVAQEKPKRIPRRKRVIGDWEGDHWDDTAITYVDTVEPLGKRRKLIPRLLALIVAMALIAVLVLGGVAMWYVRQINPPGDPGAAVNFTVNDDDDLASVSERLEDEGFIVNAGVFRWYVEREGGIDFVPGYYTLRPRDHMGNIMRVLNTPPNETYSKVTFPEGFTVRQMADRLADVIPGIDKKRFIELATDGEITSEYQAPGIASLEGLLFPDTYFVAGDESEAQILQRMIDLMERVGRQEGIDANEGNYTPHEILVIASMIEREAKVPEDRAKIARVIYNRLFLGMPLQVDATLYYGQDPKTPFSELKTLDSPYNTYMHAGLPPTPIANPGRASIEAAINPAPNPLPGDDLCVDLPAGTPCLYLYYVLKDTDGSHAFAATLEQHEANIAAARAKGLL